MLTWLVSFPLALLAVLAQMSPTLVVDFTHAPDGPPAGFVLYDNSHDTSYIPAPNGGLQVVGGALQTMATGHGLASGYAQVDMHAPVTRIGAEFEFTDATDPRGAIALPIWTQPFNETWPRVPDSPAHFLMTRTDWSYELYRDGSQVALTSGKFDPPLPVNTPLSVEIRLHGDTALLLLPDGSMPTVTDPRIAVPGRYATFESFVWDPATMTHPRMFRVWADTD